MTRAEKVARARKLRDDGLTMREIGEEMGGYAVSTVHAWLSDPDRSKEIARKLSYRGSCENCGAPTTGCNGPDNAPALCVDCYRTRHADRNAEILKLNEEGLPHWLIAEEVGCREGRVSTYLNYCRQRRGMDVPLHRLGGGAEERDRRRREIIEWRREGLSNEEIAARLGTSASSVSQMFRRCRALGMDVPRAPLGGAEEIATADELETFWAEGLTLAEIADLCGYRTPSSVASRIWKLRKEGRSFAARRPGRRAVAA